MLAAGTSSGAVALWHYSHDQRDQPVFLSHTDTDALTDWSPQRSIAIPGPAECVITSHDARWVRDIQHNLAMKA